MERLSLDRWSSPWLRNQHVERYRWSAKFAKGCRVLDAACGTGYGSFILSNHGAKHVTSVDLSTEAFDAARRTQKRAVFCAAQGDVTALPLVERSYDLYTCFETIEHIDAARRLVEEAKRVLQPNGTFLCSTPNRELLSPGNTMQDKPANPFHVREYSIAEFRDLMMSTFPFVRLFGQTWFTETYQRKLAVAGKLGNLYAVRLHQLRNIAGLPWESASRHYPRALDDGNNNENVPEVVIAVCTQ